MTVTQDDIAFTLTFGCDLHGWVHDVLFALTDVQSVTAEVETQDGAVVDVIIHNIGPKYIGLQTANSDGVGIGAQYAVEMDLIKRIHIH